MKHANAVLLEVLYADFAAGNLNAVLAACSEKMTFQVPGKSRIAGKYDRDGFVKDFAVKLHELSGGTLKHEVHDILASDLHAVVLVSGKLTRAGKPVEFRSAHVWRFENGKPVAWYEYPRDLYAFDAIWS